MERRLSLAVAAYCFAVLSTWTLALVPSVKIHMPETTGIAIADEARTKGNSLLTARRSILFQAAAGISMLSYGGSAPLVYAETVGDTSIDMKTFLDPLGMFAINVPTRFFTIRRSAKGDLPDAKGKGRRGSTIFSAGDMSKAEVVAIERFPTEILLLDNGMRPTGSLRSITDIGEPRAVATLLALKRDRDKDGTLNTKVVPDSVAMSDDKAELTFVLRTKIDVQRPELLLEQTGVSELFRITSAKASLRAGDGLMMVVYASALEADWKGPDGTALQEIVKSFSVLG
jgi:hypothetical protein